MKKIAWNIILVVGIIITLWIVASFFEVTTHNMMDQRYSAWNIFAIFVDKYNGVNLYR